MNDIPSIIRRIALELELPEDTDPEKVVVYLGQVVRVAKTHFGMPMPAWTAEQAVARRIEEIRVHGPRPMPKKFPLRDIDPMKELEFSDLDIKDE